MREAEQTFPGEAFPRRKRLPAPCIYPPHLLSSRGMLTAFYVIVLQQIFQGLFFLWEGWKWLAMARRRLGTHPGFYAPHVAVICPCKGAEPGLEENLSALARFDYPSYEVIFVIASALDPARNIMDRVVAASGKPARVLVAGAPKNCGEKVNNLRAAVQELGEAVEVMVFADSDVRLGRGWLGRMVAPLADPHLGAATTYRWYFPERGGFWSAMLSAWNAAIATQLGEHGGNFCWGGGTAIRRASFHQARALEFWEGALSDDWALTRALGAAGMPIRFVPECLAATLGDADRDGLVEFTNRQIILTRVYSPRRWLLAALTHLSYCVTLLFAAMVILDRMLTGFSWAALFLLAFVVAFLAAAKGALRAIAVQELLPEWRAKCREWSWAWIFLAAIVPFLFLWNFAVASFTRRIRWRGIRYELVSPTVTRVLPH